jgi:peptidoglycan-associated lipoprotein
MSIRVALFVVLALFMFGCSKETKEETAAVEDHSAATASQDAGAQAHGTGEQTQGGISALDDPNSPLATRVIYFEFDSSEVLPQYRSVIEAHAKYLASNPNTLVTLEGHADERGSREYNLALGERRANAIKSQMTLLGAGDNQIKVVSYGEERPALEGHDEAAWSKNRRVEFRY